MHASKNNKQQEESKGTTLVSSSARTIYASPTSGHDIILSDFIDGACIILKVIFAAGFHVFVIGRHWDVYFQSNLVEQVEAFCWQRLLRFTIFVPAYRCGVGGHRLAREPRFFS